MKFKTYIKEALKIKAKNSQNPEITKVFKLLQSKFKNQNLGISITNDENIVTITVRDNDYQAPSRGTHFVGMTKDDHTRAVKLLTKVVKDGERFLKQSKINIEDI